MCKRLCRGQRIARADGQCGVGGGAERQAGHVERTALEIEHAVDGNIAGGDQRRTRRDPQGIDANRTVGSHGSAQQRQTSGGNAGDAGLTAPSKSTA